MGVVRLRLARFGSRNRSFWRIVAIDSRQARDNMPLEYLGTYDPIAQHLDGIKEVRLRLDRIKYWLSVGGQPSDRVAYLLWRAGILPAPPIRWQTQANVNKKQLREAAKKGLHTLCAARAPEPGALCWRAAAAAAMRRQPLGLFGALLGRR